ncbi:MAG TPA: YfhO family protein, partial [Bryobacteraceae bacterium]|nr:YfhO family protein [Bryobacteraceae bacterium]
QVTHRSSGSVTLDATLACAGMVVLSEAYAPGWTATIDGGPAEIREVDGPLRGVATPAGKHRIQMRYRPRSVIWGAILTLAGLAGICVLGLRARAGR